MINKYEFKSLLFLNNIINSFIFNFYILFFIYYLIEFILNSLKSKKNQFNSNH